MILQCVFLLKTSFNLWTFTGGKINDRSVIFKSGREKKLN